MLMYVYRPVSPGRLLLRLSLSISVYHSLVFPLFPLPLFSLSLALSLSSLLVIAGLFSGLDMRFILSIFHTIIDCSIHTIDFILIDVARFPAGFDFRLAHLRNFNLRVLLIRFTLLAQPWKQLASHTGVARLP